MSNPIRQAINRNSIRTIGLSFVVVIPCILITSGCTPDRSQSVLPIATGQSVFHHVTRQTAPASDDDLYSRGRNAIVLSCGINEITAFQYVLDTKSQPAVGVEVISEPFACNNESGSHQITADAVHIYRHWPITINRYPNWYLRSQGFREPREIPDALVPIDAHNYGQPFTIRPDRSVTLWVEIRVPRDTRPGQYQGGLTLRDSTGRTSRTPIELQVRDIRPAAKDLLTVAARVRLGPIIASSGQADPKDIHLSLSNPETRKAVLRAFTLLHEHGLCPYTSDVHPRLLQDASGSVTLDWKEFDDFCGPLISGEAYPDARPASVWPLPVNETFPDPLQYDGLDSASYQAVLKSCLADAADHFAKKQWIKNSFVYFDQPAAAGTTSDDVHIIRRLCAATHHADAELAFLSTMIPQSMRPFGWFEHYWEDLSGEVDIWAPPARYAHLQTLERLRNLGRKTWLQPDRPPYSGSLAVEAPPIHARSLPWQAFIQEYQAIYLPEVTSWPTRVLDEPIADVTQPSDAWLIYPGELLGLPGPIPSVRLKQLQLGLQDYHHLCMLRDHGRGETAKLLATSLIQASGTQAYGDQYQDGIFGRRVDDPIQWNIAESILLVELENAIITDANAELPSDHLDDKGTLQSLWARFLSGTRGVEINSESQRLQPDTRDNSSGYLLNCEVAIRNELRVPVSGRLTFGGLPPGARVVNDTVRLGPLQESEVARRSLTAWFSQSPSADLDGHYLQPVLFDAGFSGKSQNVAVFSILRCPRRTSKLFVDGNLADWPPNEFNAAGDFRLINLLGANPEGMSPAFAVGHDASELREPREKARSQTVAYFCRDDSSLFIGLHAAAPTPETAAQSDQWNKTGNVVEYEDLIPLSGDLVEILIDPTNLGTRSDDLFHLVIKAGGGALFEKGIGVNPPIGKVQAWPGVLPTYATMKTAYGWSAEIAVPLDAFGADAMSADVWGLNIARLEPMRGEYSDWSRAPRYCYDPRTLGNLIWKESPGGP
jgi:hypothetical protein